MQRAYISRRNAATQQASPRLGVAANAPDIVKGALAYNMIRMPEVLFRENSPARIAYISHSPTPFFLQTGF
jgi:hypothetical protein